MQIDPEITFRGFEPPESLKEQVVDRVNKLDRLYSRLMSCRVIVDLPHNNKSQGNLYHCRVDVTIPGEELVVSRDPKENERHRSPSAAVMDAFDAMEKQLKKRVDVKRGDVKPRNGSEHQHGLIVRMFADRGYGFLRNGTGREIYFDQRSVLNGDWDKLQVNDEVRFHEEQGVEGPQASSLSRVGTNGRHEFLGHN